MTVSEAASIIAADPASSGISAQGILTLAILAAGIWAVNRPPKEEREEKAKERQVKREAAKKEHQEKMEKVEAERKEKAEKREAKKNKVSPPPPPPPLSVPPPPSVAPSAPPIGLPSDLAPYVFPPPSVPPPPLMSPSLFPPPFEQTSEEIPEGSAFPFADGEDLPGGLGRKLNSSAWEKMVRERGLGGLRFLYAESTPFGADVHLLFEGAMSLKDLQNKIHQIETGLDFHTDWKSQLKPGASAKKGVLRIITQDPIEELPWTAPEGTVRLADPLWVSRSILGEDITISVKQRIGIFGTSGSGKSALQRTVGAHVIQSVDADLEVWDLKFGTESQHYEGKAHRVTSIDSAIQRIQWLINSEFPRRATLMIRNKTSNWTETEDHPARVIMIDEGNVLIRGLSTSVLKQLFQVIEQGRALGIYFVWATQFPKAENLPTEIRSQLSCKLCLLLLTSEEAHVVFKDDVALGWTPHRMIGPGWVLIKDADHRTPEESKARWLTEDNFESVRMSGQPVSGPSGQPVSGPSGQPVSGPSGQPVSGPSGQPVSGPSGLDKIIGELMLSGDPLGVSELARRTGLAKSSVSEIIRRMEREGVVCNEGTDVRPTYVLRLAEDPEL